MLKPRIIPALLLNDKGIYKTIKFENLRYIGDPLNIIKILNDKFADELIICDINASKSDLIDIEYLKNIFQSCRMPVCYAGGISSIEKASLLYSIGVEKLGIGNTIISNPNLIHDISKIYGSQSVVSILNLVQFEDKIYLFDYINKKVLNNIDVIEFIKKIQDDGAGEVIFHFINNDGTMLGYNYQIIESLINEIKVPIVFLGGLRNLEEIVSVSKKYNPIGIAGSSLFIYKGKLKSVLINYPTNFFKVK